MLRVSAVRISRAGGAVARVTVVRAGRLTVVERAGRLVLGRRRVALRRGTSRFSLAVTRRTRTVMQRDHPHTVTLTFTFVPKSGRRVVRRVTVHVAPPRASHH
jgi:hypothetical protein